MKIERLMGTMVGLAVGDALGVPVEFMDREEIYKRYGVLDKMVGGGTWGKPAGTVSDDTEMALAVAEGIIDNPKAPIPYIGERFIRWYNGKPFDVGICCSMVISGVIADGGYTSLDWYRVARSYDRNSGGKSGGNGGLMRTAYIGCYYRDKKDVEEIAWDVCGMTHWNSVAQADCSLMSLIIHSLIDGGGKEDIEKLVSGYEFSKGRYDLAEIEGYPFKVRPSGYGVNSLKCALKCVLSSRNFKDALVHAVNMGGDTDTIGAITGAIAGALYGVDNIPDDWKKSLDRNIMERIVNVCAYAGINRLGVDGCMTFAEKNYIENNKKIYKKGQRVVMDEDMNDDSPVKPKKGDKGTILVVDDVGTVHVQWDSGSTLGLIPGEDCFHVENNA